VLGGAPFADGNQSDAGAAYAFEVTDLAIDVMPDAAQVGDKLRVHACGGLPGTAVRALVASVAGNATKRQIDSGVFDADGRFAATLAIPPSFGGNEVGFAASGYWQPGVLGTSGVVTIDVEP
jgi:hypothetical protein